MSFKDLASLDAFLVDKSYIAGFSFSVKDTEVFAAFSLPDAATYPFAYRWYIHIAALTGLPLALAYSAASTPAPAAAPTKAAPAAKKAAAADEDDDDMDLGFDDDEEEEEAAAPATNSRQAKAAKLKAENEKKLEEAKAAALARLAKKEANQRSLCNLEIKPWGEEQDLLALFAKIKKEVVRDGLKWSEGCNLVEVAFGIKKIVCTAIIPVAVSMDEIIDEMTEETFVDDIQSMNMTSMSLL